MRQIYRTPIDDPAFWKERLLHWAFTHDRYLLLDSNGHTGTLVAPGWELLVGAGAGEYIELPSGRAFQTLRDHQAETQDWLFGGFSYDLKNEVERLSSARPDLVGFPDMIFFQPETVAGIRGNTLEIQTLSASPEKVLDAIKNALQPLKTPVKPVVMQPVIPRETYLETVERLRQHIIEGDLYEVNYCQAFFSENAAVDPYTLWNTLNGLACAPMSAFFRWEDRWLLSASPERFLKKEGQKLFSQPIKGTRRRDPQNDEALRRELADSEKDRAENVMIVDLVRNDLARSCRPGSVRVEELFGIHTFETVHQMISTVSGHLRPEFNAIEALRLAFPPGSMTGAPKVMAMELIERYERSRRGLYAGALGYFDPSGDFDFNVVIRSIFYNAAAQYVSLQVGGAIVYDSDPEAEYEECLVKAAALFAALKHHGLGA